MHVNEIVPNSGFSAAQLARSYDPMAAMIAARQERVQTAEHRLTRIVGTMVPIGLSHGKIAYQKIEPGFIYPFWEFQLEEDWSFTEGRDGAARIFMVSPGGYVERLQTEYQERGFFELTPLRGVESSERLSEIQELLFGELDFDTPDHLHARVDARMKEIKAAYPSDSVEYQCAEIVETSNERAREWKRNEYRELQRERQSGVPAVPNTVMLKRALEADIVLPENMGVEGVLPGDPEFNAISKLTSADKLTSAVTALLEREASRSEVANVDVDAIKREATGAAVDMIEQALAAKGIDLKAALAGEAKETKGTNNKNASK